MLLVLLTFLLSVRRVRRIRDSSMTNPDQRTRDRGRTCQGLPPATDYTTVPTLQCRTTHTVPHARARVHWCASFYYKMP